jgi:NADPH-dependent curcumin reductase CurA
LPAGSPAATRSAAAVVDELGLDAGVNYKTPDLDRVLKEACLAGIDVYYDNVGGPVLEAVLRRINRGAPIPLVGLIAQSNAAEPPPGPTRCRCRSSGR